MLASKRAEVRPAFALFRHGFVEAKLVDRETVFTGDVRGHVGWEAVGVVQFEHYFAGNGLGVAEGADGAVQVREAGLQCGCETVLLVAQGRGDALGVVVELRIGTAHRVHHCIDQPMEERLAHAELVAMAQPPTHDAAQNVGALFVAWHDAIGDQESGRASVVCDDAQRWVVHAVDTVADANGADDVVHELPEQVVVVVAVAALHDGSDALKAHAGVYAGRIERRQCAVRRTVELRKHQVPELGIAVAILVRGTWWAARDVRPQVVEELGVRAARAGVAHRPEVVFVRHHAGGVEADLVDPDAPCIVVIWMRGHPQTVLGQLQNIGDELPSPSDGVLFEIVAEAEVAKHLEKRLMAAGVADVLKIVVLAASAHAALTARGAAVARRLAAGERVLELHHPGVGEQQGWIVGGH